MHGRWSCYLVFSFIDIYYIHVYPIVMYGCKSWTIKKVEHRRTDDFELWLLKTLERPLDCKEIKPINPKEISPEYSFWRTDVEAEVPMFWPLDEKSWLIRKDHDAGKDWRQEEKGLQRLMASLTQWTWVWASSGRWWRTGKSGVL